MRIIARIPDVSTEAAAVPRAEAAAARTRPARRPRSGDGVLARATSAWPVAALAVIAALTWMLASRNEHARLLRQRSEVRLAREPAAAPASPQPGPDVGGAVVR